MAVIFALFVKPLILYHEIDYSFKELLSCYWDCTKVLLLAGIIIIPFLYLMDNGILAAIIKGVTSFVAVGIASYIFLERQIKAKFNLFLLKRIRTL